MAIEKFKCKKGNLKLSTNKLIAKAQSVDAGTTKHSAVFVSPIPTNAVFIDNITQLLTLEDAKISLETQLKALNAQIKTQITIVISNLTQRADYVDTIALGNKDIVLLSGHPSTNNIKTKRPIPCFVTGLWAKAGKESGTIYLYWKKNSLADTFLIEESPTPMISGSYNIVDAGKKTTCILKDRVSGAIKGYRVTAKNASGVSEHSTFVVIVIP